MVGKIITTEPAGVAILGLNVGNLVISWTSLKAFFDAVTPPLQLTLLCGSIVATYWLIRKTRAQALIAERTSPKPNEQTQIDTSD